MPNLDIGENYIRARQRDPSEFDDSTFRTVVLSEDKGISSVQGKLKDKAGEADPMVLQSVLFETAKWSKTKVKEWLRSHNYKVDFAKADDSVKPEDNWQEVFRAGEYPVQGTFTEEDVAAIAANYDATKFKAPLIIIGGEHPELNDQKDVSPVGFIAKLKASGKSLYAVFEDVADGAKSLVKDNIVKGVSISFIRKTRQLIHIALCTNKPQIDDLKPLTFNVKDMDDLVTVSFAELKEEGEKKKMATANELMQACIDACGAVTGADMAGADAELMKKCVSACNACAKACGGSAEMADEKPKEKEAAMSKKEIELQQQVTELKTKQRETEAVAFIAKQITEGRLPPAVANVGGENGLARILASLPENETVSFADGKTSSLSNALRSVISALPVNPVFTTQTKTPEQLKADEELRKTNEAVAFANEEESNKSKIVAFNKKVDEVIAEKKIPRNDAMSFVARNHPELVARVKLVTNRV